MLWLCFGLPLSLSVFTLPCAVSPWPNSSGATCGWRNATWPCAVSHGSLTLILGPATSDCQPVTISDMLKLTINREFYHFFYWWSLDFCVVYLALLVGQHSVEIQATIFGKRDGVLNGLAVTSSDKMNAFKSTRGWKQGVVHSVEMLPRSLMWKPDTASWLQLFYCATV